MTRHYGDQRFARVNTSMNQSYSEKKRGRSNKSVTAPSAMGIDPRFPPLKRFVRRLLALSNKFLFVFGSSVLVDWHLHLPMPPHIHNTRKKGILTVNSTSALICKTQQNFNLAQYLINFKAEITSTFQFPWNKIQCEFQNSDNMT